MKPQQMVEHLIDQVRYTNGKKIPSCNWPSAEAEKNKRKAFDAEISRNFFLETLPDHYEFESLEMAIEKLLEELTNFDIYFEKSGATAVHGSFGAMNYDEWVYWHGRHFYHHLKQFNLINEYS
jgi:hypothetical protein